MPERGVGVCRRWSLLLMVILLATTWLIGCGDVPWTRFESEDGGFSVEIPGTPAFSSQPLTTALGRLTVNKVELNVDEALDRSETYAVIWVDYPQEPVEPRAVTVFLDGVRDGNLRDAPGTLLREESVRVHGHDARDIIVELKTGRGAYRNRFFMVKNRLYQLMVTRDRGDATQQQADRFIESFRLTGEDERATVDDPTGS